MRFRTFSCWEAFLQICDTWELNVNLKSKVTPKSFTSSSQSILYYADDNTLSYGSNSVDDVIETLEEQSDILINWFTENHMQANPDKFQAISIGRKTHEKN
jgi:hypothetical protein